MYVMCSYLTSKGVEFVCCPRKHHKHHKNNKHHKKRPHLEKKKPEIDRVALETAVKELQKFLPEQTQGKRAFKSLQC